MGSRQPEDTDPQNHPPNPTINSDSVRLRVASKAGREELLRARGDEAQSIANVLDQVFTSAHCHLPRECLPAPQILNDPTLQETERNRCSVTLQKLCGACCLLPDSHIISDGLELTNELPIANGGFANVYQGSYRGRPVAIKALKLSQADETVLSKRASTYLHIPSETSADDTHTFAAIPQRSRRLEILHSSQRPSLPWCLVETILPFAHLTLDE
jgi:hypothetical protein